MHPLALVACVAIAAGAVVAVAWLLRAPRLEQARIEELVEAARTRLELEFGKAIEQLEVIGESVRRHRARIDGAKRGAATPSAESEAPAAPALVDLTPEQASALPVPAQLEWAARRRVGRRR
jgi:hypothetical protein